MIHSACKYLFKNKLFIFLAFSIIASMIAPIYQGQNLYYLAMVITFIVALSNSHKQNYIFVSLLVWLLICSLVNNVLDPRYFSFTLVIVSASPFLSSAKTFIFRAKLILFTAISLSIFNIANLYAYETGLNYFVIQNGESQNNYFSGLAPHPMWLAAAIGAGNIVLLYYWHILSSRYKFYRITIFIGLLASIYLSVVASSRSALLASLISMIIMLYFCSKNKSDLIKKTVIVSILITLILPYYMSGADTMISKINNTQNGGDSRSELWIARWNEFLDSPIFGTGFSAIKVNGQIVTGRVETGSGWLSILSMSGIVGGVLIAIMIKRVFIPIKEIKQNGGIVILFICLFIYLCLHSFFEGYIFTAGYCPCFLFWLLLGFFYDYKKYKNKVDLTSL